MILRTKKVIIQSLLSRSGIFLSNTLMLIIFFKTRQEFIVLHYYSGHLNTRYYYYGTLTLLFLKLEPGILNVPYWTTCSVHLNETYCDFIYLHLQYYLVLINCNTTLLYFIGDSFGTGYKSTAWKKKNKTPSTNSATKNKAPLLIIQGTDFNYTENIAFKITFQTAKADREANEAIEHFFMLQQCPLLASIELGREKRN